MAEEVESFRRDVVLHRRAGFLWVSLPWVFKFSVSGHNAEGGACTRGSRRDARRWYLEEIHHNRYFLSCAPAQQTLIYGWKGRGQAWGVQRRAPCPRWAAQAYTARWLWTRYLRFLPKIKLNNTVRKLSSFPFSFDDSDYRRKKSLAWRLNTGQPPCLIEEAARGNLRPFHGKQPPAGSGKDTCFHRVYFNCCFLLTASDAGFCWSWWYTSLVTINLCQRDSGLALRRLSEYETGGM